MQQIAQLDFFTSPGRGVRGQRNHHAGLLAEDIVARHYGLRGHAEAARRWRGRRGEIDLVLRDGPGLVFVEVKKSRTHDAARARVSRRQAQRIMGAACEFVAAMPHGQMTEMRFDVATVDEAGTVEIVENAFMMF